MRSLSAPGRTPSGRPALQPPLCAAEPPPGGARRARSSGSARCVRGEGRRGKEEGAGKGGAGLSPARHSAPCPQHRPPAAPSPRRGSGRARPFPRMRISFLPLSAALGLARSRGALAVQDASPSPPPPHHHRRTAPPGPPPSSPRPAATPGAALRVGDGDAARDGDGRPPPSARSRALQSRDLGSRPPRTTGATSAPRRAVPLRPDRVIRAGAARLGAFRAPSPQPGRAERGEHFSFPLSHGTLRAAGFSPRRPWGDPGWEFPREPPQRSSRGDAASPGWGFVPSVPVTPGSGLHLPPPNPGIGAGCPVRVCCR